MVAGPIYIPIDSAQAVPFRHELANACYLRSWWQQTCGNNSKCEVIAYCGFDLYSPDD